ncbi:Pantothenate permease [uncultured Roseburia sp.]|uniref:Sodium:solute symporter family protein n=1 Tax=Brotonthovivens ammoniilytica TaxID=2981725 RepID=A0ABT2TNF2_9FIRM|nr:sodium:solute symporter family protein [Brotonthovivens ammoniilytica]MCU6763749.1 sodium:solute symporter family protein [Brotonthovivens ammoniilytica]SCJ33643.1 Pantothenate permease [uncultured Roseburia sp.]
MLSKHTLWIVFILYLCFLFFIASFGSLFQRHKTRNAEDFSTSGGTIRWPFLVMTYIASLMSTWVFFAGPGAYYRGGFGYWASELSFICLFPVIVHFVMNKVWIINRSRHYTTPADIYYDRFKSPVLRFILALVFLSASFPMVTSVLIAISKAAEIATGGKINYRYILLIIGIVIVAYVMIGGLKSIVITDTIQGLLYIAILWIIVIVCLLIGFNGSLGNAVSTVWENTSEWFSYPGPDNWVPYSARLGYPLCCAIGWTIMLPHVFIRSGYAGSSLQTQRKLMFLTPVLQVIVWSGCMIIGLVAMGLMPGLSTSETEYIIPYLIQNVIQNIHPAAAFILMIGFFIGSVSVGVTTADSFLLVSGSILTEDILVNTLHLKLSEKGKLTAVRIVIAFIGVISIFMALKPPGLIFTLIMFANAIVMPLFPILVIGIYWKRATKQAAIISAAVGTALVLMTYFVWNLGGSWYGTFGLIGSTVCMIFFSLITKQNPADSTAFYEALKKGEEEFYETEPRQTKTES